MTWDCPGPGFPARPGDKPEARCGAWVRVPGRAWNLPLSLDAHTKSSDQTMYQQGTCNMRAKRTLSPSLKKGSHEYQDKTIQGECDPIESSRAGEMTRVHTAVLVVHSHRDVVKPAGCVVT